MRAVSRSASSDASVLTACISSVGEGSLTAASRSPWIEHHQNGAQP